MAKIVCVLYEDPVTGYPRTYARDDIPDIERYPGGQTTPTPKSIDFKYWSFSRARCKEGISGVQTRKIRLDSCINSPEYLSRLPERSAQITR